MREKFTRVVLPQAPATVQDIYDHWRKRYGNTRFVYPGEGYVNLRDRISPEEKEQIFAPANRAMREIGKTHGLILPEDLLARLIIVDGVTFQNIYRLETGSSPTMSLAGITLANRMCLVNFDEVNYEASTHGKKPADLLKQVGAHELWHSNEYAQDWVQETANGHKNENPLKLKAKERFQRRKGIVVERPGEDNEVSMGLKLLKEGYTENLTRQTLAECGTDYHRRSRVNELGLAEEIIQAVGSDHSFFLASYTKFGFRKLVEDMEKLYGHHGLRRLALDVHSGYRAFCRRIVAEESDEVPLDPNPPKLYLSIIQKIQKRNLVFAH